MRFPLLKYSVFVLCLSVFYCVEGAALFRNTPIVVSETAIPVQEGDDPLHLFPLVIRVERRRFDVETVAQETCRNYYLSDASRTSLLTALAGNDGDFHFRVNDHLVVKLHLWESIDSVVRSFCAVYNCVDGARSYLRLSLRRSLAQAHATIYHKLASPHAFAVEPSSTRLYPSLPPLTSYDRVAVVSAVSFGVILYTHLDEDIPTTAAHFVTSHGFDTTVLTQVQDRLAYRVLEERHYRLAAHGLIDGLVNYPTVNRHCGAQKSMGQDLLMSSWAFVYKNPYHDQALPIKSALARTLYCMAQREDVVNILDVYCCDGSGTTLYLARGIAASAVPEKHIWCYDRVDAFVESSKANLHTYAASVSKSHNITDSLYSLCGDTRVDFVMLDGDARQGTPELEPVLNVCRPKFVGVHNTQFYEMYRPTDALLRDSEAYRVYAQGYSVYRQLKDDQWLNTWTIFKRVSYEDPLNREISPIPPYAPTPPPVPSFFHRLVSPVSQAGSSMKSPPNFVSMRNTIQDHDHERSVDEEEVVDVIIIGAGPLGIKLAARLFDSDMDVVVLEAQQVAQTVSEYHPSILLHSIRTRLSLADHVPLECALKLQCTRDEFLAHIRDVVNTLDLTIRTRETVTSLERVANSHPRQRFRVRTRTRSSLRSYRSAFIVVSTGDMSHPRYLDVPGGDLPHVHYLPQNTHSYFGLSVCVVGGGASAIDMANFLVSIGAKVAVVVRGAEYKRLHGSVELNNHIAAGTVRAFFHSSVTRITPTSVELLQCIPLQPDGCVSGSVSVSFVVPAIGFEQDVWVTESLGIDKRQVNPATFESSQMPGLYLNGNYVLTQNFITEDRTPVTKNIAEALKRYRLILSTTHRQ